MEWNGGHLGCQVNSNLVPPDDHVICGDLSKELGQTSALFGMRNFHTTSRIARQYALLCILVLTGLIPQSVRGGQPGNEPATVQYDAIGGVDPALLSMDIYTPRVPDKSPYPVIAFVHGGGWFKGDKAGVEEMAMFFNDKGYVFCSINYRLSSRDFLNNSTCSNTVQYPAHPRDVSRAVAWIFHNIHRFEGDPERVGLIGHSAGGHLVSLVATDESFLKAQGLDLSVIKACCNLDAGSLNIPKRFEVIQDEYPFFAQCILNAFGSDPMVWARASPTLNITPGKKIPPMLLVHQKSHIGRTADHTEMLKALLDNGYIGEIFSIDLDHGEIKRLLGNPTATDLPKKQNRAKELSEKVAEFFNNHLISHAEKLHSTHLRSFRPIGGGLVLSSYHDCERASRSADSVCSN